MYHQESIDNDYDVSFDVLSLLKVDKLFITCEYLAVNSISIYK